MERTKGFGFSLLKGLLVGLSVCLALILVFALVLKFADLGDFWVKTINQIIKLCAVVAACFVSVNGSKGYIKGCVTGLSVVVCTYLLFGLVSGSLSFGWGTALELVYGIIVGTLAGILAANVKKNPQ